MIRSFELENFGPIEALSEDSIGQVNVFIGPNAAGKTFLLKALYTFIRTTEEFGLGNDPRRFEKILADKLYWTFQVDKLGELITKGSNGRLRLSMETDQGSGTYSFGTQTINPISILSFTDESIERYNLLDGMPDNSIIQESIDLYEEEVRLSFDEGPESRARSFPSAAQRKPRRIISESSGISNTSS